MARAYWSTPNNPLYNVQGGKAPTNTPYFDNVVKGYLASSRKGGMIAQKPQQPAAPKPAPKPAAKPKRKAAPKKTKLTAPPKPALKAVNDPITPKERAEISKPAKGLESTIKTNPVRLREKRRRSYLTAGAY